MLHCLIIHYLTLHYITMQHFTLHNITLQHITLHYITLHIRCIVVWIAQFNLCYVGRKSKHNKEHNQLLFRNSLQVGCGIAMHAMKLTSVFLFPRRMPCTRSCLISVSHFIQLLHNGWCSWLPVGHMTLRGHHVIPAPSFHFQM